MKKLQVLIISLLFLISNNIQASFLQGPNPYSFGPQGRSVSDLRDFGKPKQMVRILPNMPVVATDSSGNRVYYTPDGKMTLSVAKDGSMTFSLGGLSKNYNSDGDYSGSTKTMRGSGLLQKIRNKDDQVIGYRALNGDGKTSRTYDKNKNLTATYVYTGQGAKIDYVQNEMTGGRTYYDEHERAMKDVDMDGYILRTYQYEDVSYVMLDSDSTRKELTVIKKDPSKVSTGLLVSSRDYGYNTISVNTEKGDVQNQYVYNTTYYDEEGKVLYTQKFDGFITAEYHYKQDNKGNKILDYVINNLDKTKTFYDEYGSRDYTVNDADSLITKYYDDYAVNYNNGAVTSVTRYDIDGTELYTTFKNVIYNNDGTIDEVRDEDDFLLKKYHYKYDSEGNKIIDYVESNSDVDFNQTTYTWYSDEGKPMWVTSTDKRPGDITADNIIKTFSWSEDGNTLIFTTNKLTGKVDYYDWSKEEVYEAFNERLLSKNIYDNGQLIAKWDEEKKELTILINERQWLTFKLPRIPESDSIRAIMAHAKDINDELEANRERVKRGEKASSEVTTKLLATYGLIDSYPKESDMDYLVKDHIHDDNNE